MHAACVLVTATCPDPKLAKAALAPFHASRDGQTTISTSGFVLLHGGQPLVVTSATAVLPLLQHSLRQALQADGSSLAAASSADLVPGAQLHALAACSGDAGVCASSSSPQQPVGLHLVGLAELPGVRQALELLLSAPSIAGPAGWQLGWLLHRPDAVHATQQRHATSLAPWVQGRGGGGSSSGGAAAGVASPAAASPSAASAVREAACHVAVLTAASAAGVAALAQHALAWPSRSSALCVGQPVQAVGAPFGTLAPRHFVGFTTCGVVSATIPGGSSSGSAGSGSSSAKARGARSSSADAGGSGSTGPALLLSDLRCGPGMEGSPVFEGAAAAAATAAAAGAAAAGLSSKSPERMLAGMLLPPIRSAAAQVEFTLLAPAPAVAASVLALLQRCSPAPEVAPAEERQQPWLQDLKGAAPSIAASAARAAAAGLPSAQLGEALAGVVAVLAGNSWASGVIISPAGHILTNAHLLEPAMHPALPSSGRQPAARLPTPVPAAGAPAAGGTTPALAHPPVRVLLPGSSSGGPGSVRWAAADVLYLFSGPLDLAVLQLQQSAKDQPHRAPAWRPLALSTRPPEPGQPVCVAGFPAFNPRGELLGPLLTAGALAKVLRLPGGGAPAMLLTTAAVYSGASGGAVLDAHTGQLLGLVTSNAKHSSRAGGASDSLGGAPQGRHTILPHINFSIPAAQLQPVAAAAAAAGMPDAAAALAAWRALDAATAGSPELRHVWRLDRRQQRPAEQQQPGDGAFGGARPPAKLQQLLAELQQQQQQPQQQQREEHAKGVRQQQEQLARARL